MTLVNGTLSMLLIRAFKRSKTTIFCLNHCFMIIAFLLATTKKIKNDIPIA